MERFLKKRRTSVQDENVGPSHENNQNDGSVPTQSDRQIDASTHEQIDVPTPPSSHGQNDASTHALLGKGMLVAHRICLLMAHYRCATGITPLELNSNGAPPVRH